MKNCIKNAPRLFASLLAFLLLSACTGKAAETPFPDRPENSIVVDAAVTEGRTPAEDYDLPVNCMDLYEWDAQGYTLALLAELPEAQAAFYGLAWNKALLRWGTSLAEFDWPFATPRAIPPQIWQFDIDGDWQNELIVNCYKDSGAGVSIEELHIIEKNSDNTLTDYAFPETAWREKIWEQAAFAHGANRGYLSLGREMAEFSIFGIPEDTLPEAIGTGEIAEFDISEDRILFQGVFCLDRGNGKGSKNVADYSAGISYHEGAFLLTDFHLYSYEE